jgi:NifU-like protein
MWNYTEKVREHYLHPRNVGEIEHPDGFGEVGNITCGDALRLTFTLDKNKLVKDIRFKTFGCGSAIASASVLTEMCKGKTLDEIKKITNMDIARELDGLPKEKMHCSVMGQEALEAAIRFYESGGKLTNPSAKEGRIVCTCFGVTEQEIETAVRANTLTTVQEVTNFTKAGGGCGGCHEEIKRIINRISGTSLHEPAESKTHLTTIQKIDKVREVLETDVKPILAQDGGGCELIDIDGNTVYVRLAGHCAVCGFSNMTLVSVIEKKIKEKVSDELVVKLG